ncbi:MAG: glycosyltransferase [Gammaproteobacteria bacterium]
MQAQQRNPPPRSDLPATVPGSVAFILKGYPRLSETFIAQEIHALERRGLNIRIVSLRHPTDKDRHPVHDDITAPVCYLPEYLHQEPRRVMRAWWAVRVRAPYREAWRAWWRDFRRDLTRNRIRRFGQAVVLAHELPASVTRLHAHFLHTPASVARYAGLIAGLPWSCSAHAKDIWTIPDWEKEEKLSDCRWLVTCTAANHEHLRALASDPERVTLVYHGLDFARFAAPERDHSRRNGANANDPVRLLSVGRLVAKKGYDDLLQALARLPRTLHWRLTHIGGGPLLAELTALAESLGIAARVEWKQAQPQQEVLRHYRESDLFVLASRITPDGDRDGLPNVLVEAQSQKLACLATRISGIPELIRHEETGLLVEQRDIAALADGLERLTRDAELRIRLGEAGFERVRSVFSLDAGIVQLMQRFGMTPN